MFGDVESKVSKVSNSVATSRGDAASVLLEVALLERVQQGDPDALLQYQELLEARQAQMEAAGVLKEK